MPHFLWGADDIVSKPYDPLVIRKRLENLLAVREMQKQIEKLENQVVKHMIQDKIDKIESDAVLMLKQVKKCAQSIKIQQDNFELADELTDDMVKEVETFVNTLSNRD